MAGNSCQYLPGLTQTDSVTPATAANAPNWTLNTPSKGNATCDNTTPSGSHFSVILVAMGDGSTCVVTKASGDNNWSEAITPASGDVFDATW